MTGFSRLHGTLGSISLLAIAAGIAEPANAADAVEAAPAVELAAAVIDGGEIFVSARRREERAQDVPIALSTVDDEQLERTGSYTLGQVQQLVPSLQVFSFNPRNTNINIRGLGSNVALTNDGLENGVGVYIDQVYYGRVGQSQFDLVDLDRVEVLRGPQGTLFGKNTTAGAINITTRLPSFEPEFQGEASLGDYGYHQVRGSASAPLIADRLAFRLSLADTHRDGFIEHVGRNRKAQDYDNFTARGQLLAKPTDSLDIRLIGDFSRQTLNCCVNVIVGTFNNYDNGAPVPNNFLQRVARAGYTPLPSDPFARRTDVDSHFQANMTAWGFSGQIDWDLGGNTLTSVTAYRRWNWNPANDADWTGLNVLTLGQQLNRQRQFSQELRLASSGDRRVDYVAGLYYFWQIVRGYGATAYGTAAPNWFLPTTPVPTAEAALSGFRVDSTSTPETRSYAAFGQLTWHVTDSLELTGGLRYTYERKKGAFVQEQTGGASLAGRADAATIQAIRNNFNPAVAFEARDNDGSISGLATLSYKLSPDALVYASYSRGAKSGGLNLSVLPAGVPAVVKPEKVDSYEVGLKSTLFDKLLTFNAAGFWTEVTDYQSSIIEQILNTTTYRQYIANVGKVRSRGVEADALLSPVPGISLSAGVAYTDAKYLDYSNAQAPVERLNEGQVTDLSGEVLAGVPKFTYTLGLDVAQPVGDFAGPVELYGHVDWSHRSSFYTAVSNSRFSRVEGYGLANARIGLRTKDSRWDLSVWARNLFDKDYFQTLTPANTGLITGVVGEPRTVGVTLRTKL